MASPQASSNHAIRLTMLPQASWGHAIIHAMIPPVRPGHMWPWIGVRTSQSTVPSPSRICLADQVGP
eukprot:13634122-Alexandrium_andersonii.AAC.1